MKKTERLSFQLADLERDYRALLTEALVECAGGSWGLFGHNEHIHESRNSRGVGELRNLAQLINRLRERLGDGPFPLHEDFESSRGWADANAPGEPKQAEAWL